MIRYRYGLVRQREIVLFAVIQPTSPTLEKKDIDKLKNLDEWSSFLNDQILYSYIHPWYIFHHSYYTSQFKYLFVVYDQIIHCILLKCKPVLYALIPQITYKVNEKLFLFVFPVKVVMMLYFGLAE